MGEPVLLAAETVAHAVSRTDEGFGVLYMNGADGSSHTAALRYQRLLPAE